MDLTGSAVSDLLRAIGRESIAIFIQHIVFRIAAMIAAKRAVWCLSKHLALSSILLLAGCATNIHAGYAGLCLDAAYPSGNSTKVIAMPQTIPTPHFIYKGYNSTYEIVMSTSDVLSTLELISKSTRYGYAAPPEHNAPLKLLNSIIAAPPNSDDTELSAYDDGGIYWGLIQLLAADILEDGRAAVVSSSSHEAVSNVTMQRENFESGSGRRFFDSNNGLILVTSECIVD